MTASHEFVSFVIGIFVFIYSWRLIQRTLADMARDSLFELRDNLREDFARGKSLNSKSYRSIRALINAYLANLEKISIATLLIFYAFSPIKRMDVPQESKFDVDDDLQEAIKKGVERANHICAKYTFYSGLPFLPLTIPMVLILKRIKEGPASSESLAFKPIHSIPMKELERPVAIVVQRWANESAQKHFNNSRPINAFC